ncbi:MAG: glycosyltransferase, partial [Clostridia bacterium]|nr:glycosyltransferase [Clostridia bacterium]
MKKKILFVLNQMGAGGIAKSLSNLLFHLEKYKDEYEVDLFLLRKDGCYMQDIPSYVNVLEAKGILKLFGASQRDTKKFGKWQYFCRYIVACWTKLFGNYIPLKIGAKQNKLNKQYDLAVAFAHTQGGRDMAAVSVEFVLDGVKANKKCDVMHGDVVIENLLTKATIKRLKKFDKVFSVSQSCSKQVKERCEELINISDYLYNTQRNDIIINKSQSDVKLYDNNFNMVMVSRLENQKAHLRFLPIVKRLHNEGFEFNLNIVGDGILKEEIKEYLNNNNMNDYVKMFGQQSNPFPYIKQSDLFVLVSYYEAAPMVYNEAQLLKVPVFTTDIISAKEMVGDLGFVCDNTEEDIYVKLKEVL